MKYLHEDNRIGITRKHQVYSFSYFILRCALDDKTTYAFLWYDAQSRQWKAYHYKGPQNARTVDGERYGRSVHSVADWVSYSTAVKRWNKFFNEKIDPANTQQDLFS